MKTFTQFHAHIELIARRLMVPSQFLTYAVILPNTCPLTVNSRLFTYHIVHMADMNSMCKEDVILFKRNNIIDFRVKAKMTCF